MSTLWRTRDGHEVEIRQMSSSHLLATIHYIERNRLSSATDAYFRDAETEIVEYYLQWPEQYEELVIEAQRRQLVWRNVSGVVRRKSRG